MGIQVTVDGLPISVKQWRFPCGEAGVKLDEKLPFFSVYAEVTLKWEGNDDLMALAQVVDALRHQGISNIDLNIPYFPYSRQDRRCHDGEGHALKMVAQFINSLKFDKVTTMDAHSYVLEAVVDNLRVTPQWACADRLPLHDVLIAPDAGAAKKIFTLNMVACAKVEVLIANKTRHANGAVTTTLDGYQRALGKRVCVVDDLCDGGATFLSLAEILLENCRFDGGEPAELNLYVTHGFFTKGVETLLAFYDNIYVHNNMNPAVADKIKEI